jgi:hypothetical protein
MGIELLEADMWLVCIAYVVITSSLEWERCRASSYKIQDSNRCNIYRSFGSKQLILENQVKTGLHSQKANMRCNKIVSMMHGTVLRGPNNSSKDKGGTSTKQSQPQYKTAHASFTKQHAIFVKNSPCSSSFSAHW